MKQPDYENYAQFYDYFELAGYEESDELNIFLNEVFNLNDISSVLDVACGTGAQSIGLAKRGYKVTAADKSPAMVKLAQQKAAKRPKLTINFRVANMIDTEYGCFDAAICIFNAIGHLTKKQCGAFFLNMVKNVKKGGLFVTDIFNFTALNAGVFAEYKYMSREMVIAGKLINHVRSSELDPLNRTIHTSSSTRLQDGGNEPSQIDDSWEMKIYDADELTDMLKSAGFKEVNLFGSCGTEFDKDSSDSILAICQT
jgi:ubiquinone/menaquinone biosynthesis C-methylase UbiE